MCMVGTCENQIKGNVAESILRIQNSQMSQSVRIKVNSAGERVLGNKIQDRNMPRALASDAVFFLGCH